MNAFTLALLLLVCGVASTVTWLIADRGWAAIPLGALSAVAALTVLSTLLRAASREKPPQA